MAGSARATERDQLDDARRLARLAPAEETTSLELAVARGGAPLRSGDEIAVGRHKFVFMVGSKSG